MSVVVDGAHGAAYRVGPAVFEELGATVTSIGVDPDGTNINDGVGSMHPEVAAGVVREVGADAGVCLDGDADRCVLIDGAGQIVDGDHVLAICGRDRKQRDALPADTVVATVMSNLGLDLALREVGVNVVRTDVGDRYVVERMRADGVSLGGEQSGHTIFLDYNTTGDGLVTALQVMQVVRDTGVSLADLAAVMQPSPQILKNVDITERLPIEDMPGVETAIKDAESTLGDRGRVLVRYSGTQPLARVMVEGEDAAQIESLARDIVSAFEAASA
jgi:phosphoglucosamine mutase